MSQSTSPSDSTSTSANVVTGGEAPTAELVILGSAAGVPTATRFPHAMLLKTPVGPYLIDCGAPVVNSLKALGEDPQQIRAVLLTHWHPDHVTSLPMLIQDLQLNHRREPLPLYGPPGTADKLDDLLRLYLIPREVLPFEIEVHEYSGSVREPVDGSEEEVLVAGSLRVRCFRTNHLNTDQWQRLHAAYGEQLWPLAYGLIFNVESEQVLISGDIKTSEDLVPHLPGCTLVSHEFGHMPLEQVREFAVRHGIKRFLVTHIHHEWTDRTDEMREILEQGYAGEVIVGSDGLRIPLSA